MGNLPPKILVVDDERRVEDLFRQYFRKQLKAQEFEFLFARDADSALSTLKVEKQIGLMLTDIKMADKDGFTLLKEVKQITSSIDVIFVSAYANVDNMKESMRQGAKDFFPKPINLKGLRQRIEEILAEQEMERVVLEMKARKEELSKYKSPSLSQVKENVHDFFATAEFDKIQFILELTQTLSVEELELLIEELDLKLETAIEQAEKRRVSLDDLCHQYYPELLNNEPPTLEDYQRGVKKSTTLPEIQLKEGEWVEEKYANYTSKKTGEKRVYGPYYVIRGRYPNGQLYTVSLGSLDKLLKKPEVLSMLKRHNKISAEQFKELTESVSSPTNKKPSVETELKPNKEVSSSPPASTPDQKPPLKLYNLRG